MIINVPDTCGQCVLAEKSSDGKLWCRYKANLLSCAAIPPNDGCKVMPEDQRPDICPYNEIIQRIVAFEAGNMVKS